MPPDTSAASALALRAGVCHKGGVKWLRDFEIIAAFLSEREVDELQAAIDARRETRAPKARPTDGAECNDPGPPARPTP